MKITGLKLRNFKCYEELDLRLPADGFSLLCATSEADPGMGSNGAGKSTLFDAICWCLYKRTSKGHDAGKLLTDTGKASTYSVELELDGGMHHIKRTWSPNILMLNGDVVGQEAIDDMIGLNYEQFLLAVYARQGGDHFVDLSPAEKLSFLSEIFGLERWVKRSDHCKEQAKHYQGKMAEALRIAGFSKQNLEDEQQRLQLLEEASRTWAESIDAQRQEMQVQALELSKKEAEWDVENQARIAKEQQELAKVQEQLAARQASQGTDFEQQLLQLDQQIAGLNVGALQSSLWSCKQRETDAQARATSLTAKANAMVNSPQSTCDACGQAINADQFRTQMEKLFTEIETETKLAADAASKRAQAEADLATAQAQQKDLTSLRDQVLTVMAKEREQGDTIKALSAQAQFLTDQINKPVLNPYTGEKEMLQRQLAEQPVNPNTITIAECISSIQKKEATLADITKEVDEHAQNAADFDAWARWFPELRMEILDELMDELEVYLNQALTNLGMPTWTITVSTERELKDGRQRKEINLTLLRDGLRPTDITVLSGGEQQRLKVASAIGLSDLIKAKLGSPIELLILDEPSLGLSAEGIDALLAYLRQVSHHTPILFAEHRVTDSPEFDTIIRVTKQADGTRTVKVEHSAIENRQHHSDRDDVSAGEAEGVLSAAGNVANGAPPS